MNADCDYDYDGLPHPEIRQLVSRLEESSIGSSDLDDAVMRSLRAGEHRGEEFQPTRNIDDAIFLIPTNWWWNVTHLGAEVIPTVPAPGAEAVMTNAGKYDERGRPIRYSSMSHYDRAHLPCAVCAAMLKAVYNLPMAYGVQATATEQEPDEVIKARQERIAAWREQQRQK